MFLFEASAVAAEHSALALDDECTAEELAAQKNNTHMYIIDNLCFGMVVWSAARCALGALQRRARTSKLLSLIGRKRTLSNRSKHREAIK